VWLLESGWVGSCSIHVDGLRIAEFLAIGYGATTFPGLTEAITYEKNITLIHHEANRLEILLKALAATIEP
jgi:N-acetylated-alpha-linked acidic dipeptidase